MKQDKDLPSILLTKEEWNRFIEAINNPAPPTAAMIATMREFLEEYYPDGVE